MKRFPQLLAFAVGGGLALGILQSLSACSEGAVSTLVTPVGTFASVDEAGKRELDRLYATIDARAASPSDQRGRDQLRDVFRHVRANYVYPVNDTVLIDAAIKGMDDLGAAADKNPDKAIAKTDSAVLVDAALESMVASLDPHSEYLNPDELKERRVFAAGRFGGLGIQVTLDKDSGAIKVISPIEDTPADRAGIKAGDLITHIDGDAVKGKTLTDAVKIMRGRPGTTIRLTIQRGTSKTLDVTLERAIIKVRSVRWRLENDIAYIRISSFTEQTAPGLSRALDEAAGEAAKAGNLKGIVLDLRNNPGGLLSQAVEVSDRFLASGEIVSIRPRHEQQGRAYMAHSGGIAGALSETLPVVVLINEGSASASEIVAGALKDNARAVIMGRRSFGKGSVQTVQPMPIEGALQLTTALYYVPSGTTIQALGVMPDIILEVPDQPAAANVNEAETKTSADTAALKPPSVMPREADLPGALKGVSKAEALRHEGKHASVERDQCPAAEAKSGGESAAVATEGEPAGDRELGCALLYLRATSPEAFFSAIAAGAVL